MSEALDRGIAQFFFEVGYGACWAQAYVKSGGVAPFALTDADVEHAWLIAGEAHDDPAEFDSYLAKAAAAPDLYAALDGWRKLHDDMVAQGGDVEELPSAVIDRFARTQRALIEQARAALAKASPSARSLECGK